MFSTYLCLMLTFTSELSSVAADSSSTLLTSCISATSSHTLLSKTGVATTTPVDKLLMEAAAAAGHLSLASCMRLLLMLQSLLLEGKHPISMSGQPLWLLGPGAGLLMGWLDKGLLRTAIEEQCDTC